LIIVDPAGAYVGRVDDYKDSALRTLLGPLSELAARRDVSIVLIKHLVKGATIKAVDKIGGSAGYVNAVRAAFLVLPDATTPDLKYFLPVKTNIMVKPAGLAFTLQGLSASEAEDIVRDYGRHLDTKKQEDLKQQFFRPQWQGPVTLDANKVLAEQGYDQAAKKERAEAREAEKKAMEDDRVAGAVSVVRKAKANGGHATAQKIREAKGWSGGTTAKVLKRAIEDAALEPYEAEVEAANGAKVTRPCYREPVGQTTGQLDNATVQLSDCPVVRLFPDPCDNDATCCDNGTYASTQQPDNRTENQQSDNRTIGQVGIGALSGCPDGQKPSPPASNSTSEPF
jgi:hypothetical protein